MSTEERKGSRRAYAVPEVEVHGDIKAVTAAGGIKSMNADNATMGPSKTS